MGSVLGGLASSFGGMAAVLGGLVAFFAAIWTSFPTVETGWVGVRYLWGRVWIRQRERRWFDVKVLGQTLRLPIWSRVEKPYPFIVQPGIKCAPYGLMAIRMVSLQPRELLLEAFDVDLDFCGVVRQHHIVAKAVWRISGEGDCPVRSVVYGQNSLDGNVRNLCANALRWVYTESGEDPTQLLTDSGRVYDLMKDRCASALIEYGAVLDSLQLIGTARSFGQKVSEAGSVAAAIAATT